LQAKAEIDKGGGKQLDRRNDQPFNHDAAFPSRRRMALGGDASDLLLVEKLLQFAGLKHLPHDVAAADEFTLHIELRNGRPVAVDLDALANAGLAQHVDGFELHAEMRKNLYRRRGEAALREDGRALHEQ